MKYVLIVSLLFSMIANHLNTKSEVFICKTASSKKYHYSSNCRGLSRCSTKIYKVSLEEAKKLNRTLCGWED